jgi:hypothetical protein
MSTVPDPGPVPNPNPRPNPAVTAHDLAAARLLGDVQSLVQVVRGYGSFLHPSESRRINPTATLPTEFLLAVAVALDESEQLRANAGITGDQIRDVVSFCNAYLPAAEEVRLKAEGIVQTVKAQRYAVGQVSLRVYRVARHSNIASDKQLLFPHVENMKRILNRGRKKKVKSEGGDATTGAPKTAPKAGGA